MPKRRANGEGNIRKRKDGRWEGRYTAGYDANGKAITKNVLGKTQAEVKDKLRTAIEDSKKLDPVKAGSYQQKRRAAGRKTGHQHTENVKFHPNGSSPRGHSETSCGRTRTPSCKSVFVPVSAHRGNVGSGRLPQAARQDHQRNRRRACAFS